MAPNLTPSSLILQTLTFSMASQTTIISSGPLGTVSVLSPSILERCLSVTRFVDGGNRTVIEDIKVLRLNQYYRFYDVWVNPKDLALYIDNPTCLVFNLDLSSLVYWFRFFSLTELKLLCRTHGIRHGQRTKTALGSDMHEHKCLQRCEGLVYVFKSLPKPRRHISKFFEEHDNRFQFSYIPPAPRDTFNDAQSTHVLHTLADASVESIQACPVYEPIDVQDVSIPNETREARHEHLKPLDRDRKESIIREWQKEMSASKQRQVVCAACAIRISVDQSVYVPATDVDLTLLRNDCLPLKSLPTSYDLELYKRAILHPRGLEDTSHLGRMRLCTQCHKSLQSSKMPKFALSNWLYYGYEELPGEVLSALNNTSIFERMLICRARANTITCCFNTRYEDTADSVKDSVLKRARKGVRGNVLVAPLDVVRMNTVIPPCSQSIRDTMCAVFIGKTVPTRATIHFYRPILVRKNRVKQIIEFLLKYNSHYKPVDGFRFSEENLNDIFGVETEDKLPHGVHIGHMQGNDAIDSTVADYTPRNEDEDGKGKEYDELLMENVGYTEGDDSPLAYLTMKALALARCLQGKPFIASGTGPQIVPDFRNPSILTWLFPHLDPWGIGGFYHAGRTVEISMFDQLCHLLKVNDSPFQRDPEFAFVFHNVCRKAMVTQSLRFTVSRNIYRKVAADLLSIDPEVLIHLNEECQRDPYYKAQGEKEKRVFKILSDIRTVSKRLPGSDGYKIMLRNEIRALINYKGTPTLFITINPSDVDHPLVRLLGGEDVQLDDINRGEELSKWERSLFAAKNPAACAKFFDVMINRFINIILRYGRDGDGLYGRCSAYYGTVEAQGKGTLHCHMLIWLDGHLSPQDLKEAMTASETYREKVLAWMESIISREFPGSSGVDQQTREFPRRVLCKDTGDPHPGVVMPPSITNYANMTEFWKDFNCFLIRILHQFAWHEHQATCWKYLEHGQAKTDAHCRMGMDGTTQEKSEFDTELNEISLRRHHPKIAPHTDIVSFLLQCNTDVKFVGSGEAAKAFLYYVTDYITKASLTVHAGMSALSYAVKKIYTRVPGGLTGLSDNEAKGAVITAVNSMMGRQEISQPQVMSYLVGGGDHYKSHKFVILQWSAFRKYSGIGSETDAPDVNLKSPSIIGVPQSELVDGPVSLMLGRKTITASSQCLDYIYRSNDVKFDGLCLYDFVSWVAKVGYSKQQDRTPCELAGAFIDEAHPQYSTHYLSIRRRGYVPVILGQSIPNPKKSDAIKEEWSRDMLLLFKPWRLASELKLAELSWSEAFTAYEINLSAFHCKIIKNMQALVECSEARDRHRSRLHGKPTVGHGDGAETLVDDVLVPEDCDGINDQNFDIFEDPDPFRALEHEERSGDGFVGGAGEILDETSSRLLNMCLPVKMEDITKCSGKSTLVGPAKVNDVDLPKMAKHLAIMQIKKKRQRPYTSEDSDDNPDSTLSRERSDKVPIAERVVLQSDCWYRKGKARKEHTIAETIIDELSLRNNERQLKAFRIIARQLIDQRENQLLMHVAGVGGTGKSHVIRAVVLLFERLGRRHELLLGAPTGIAAVLINGQTLHSLINLNPNGKQSNVTQLIEVWKDVKFLIVDEVSMIGARFLSQMSSRMRQGKGNDSFGRERPFGGVNVIFMGDFGQLKPPRQYALYANELVKNPSFAESRNDKGISAMNGVFLWRQVRNVVELVKNQRQAEDPEYAEFLSRLRMGRCIAHEDGQRSDLDYLRTRLLEVQASNLTDLEAFRDAPIIVGSKALRDLLNVKLVRYHARRTGQEPALYFSYDSINRSSVDSQVRDRLWSLPSSINKEAFGRLPLFIGMKVMITENLAFGDGIVNGAEGYVVDIKYEEGNGGRRYAKVVYVQVPGCGINIDGLGSDVVPIFPVVTRIEHGLSDSRLKSKAFSRRQVPIVPAYVYTDYKSQGRTLPRVIVDLSTARGQGVYVMLSRVKSLSGLLILRWFSPSKIYHRLSEELRSELARISDIALNTPDVE